MGGTRVLALQKKRVSVGWRGFGPALLVGLAVPVVDLTWSFIGFFISGLRPESSHST